MKNLPLPDFLFSDLIALHAPALAQLICRRERLEARIVSMQSTGVHESQGLAEWLAPFVNQRRATKTADGITTIHVNDVLSHGTTELDRAFGMTDYAQLIADLHAAAADPAVRGILLDINSPGGSAVGAPEAAQAVLEARQQGKPVAAHIGVIGCSAAYYLASAASVITASPSAIVGSIGTIASFYDFAGMLAKFGVTPHIFTPKAADLKATGTQDRPPTEAESAFLQTRVETLNAAFTGWVGAWRTQADASSMRGQWFTGEEATQNGLADYTGTLADSLASLRAFIGTK